MDTPVPTRTVKDLTGMLNHAGHVLETQLTAALDEIGLTPRMQCILLNALGAERTQSELAKLAYIDKTTMVVTVDELEKAGYAERRPSSVDRRARIIAVTEAGARIAGEAQTIIDRVHREVISEIPADERKAFVDALTRLVEGRLSTPAEPARAVRRTRQAAR